MAVIATEMKSSPAGHREPISTTLAAPGQWTWTSLRRITPRLGVRSAVSPSRAYYSHMSPRRRLIPRLRRWSRCLAALLTLVLQVGVGAAPLLDHDGRIPASHAEHRGHRHPRQHNERSCVICGVHAMQARTVSTDPAPLPTHGRQSLATTMFTGVPAARDAPASNSSRAPPQLS